MKKIIAKFRKNNGKKTVQSVYDSARNTPNYYPTSGKVSGVDSGKLRDAYRLAGNNW